MARVAGNWPLSIYLYHSLFCTILLAIYEITQMSFADQIPAERMLKISRGKWAICKINGSQEFVHRTWKSNLTAIHIAITSTVHFKCVHTVQANCCHLHKDFDRMGGRNDVVNTNGDSNDGPKYCSWSTPYHSTRYFQRCNRYLPTQPASKFAHMIWSSMRAVCMAFWQRVGRALQDSISYALFRTICTWSRSYTLNSPFALKNLYRLRRVSERRKRKKKTFSAKIFIMYNVFYSTLESTVGLMQKTCIHNMYRTMA